MRRYWAAAALLALIVVITSLPERARAGGTLVVADQELSAAECAAGTRADFVGFDAGARVLGCVAGPQRDYLLAADVSDGSGNRFICLYLAPEGFENEGPCLSLSPKGDGQQSPLTGAAAPMVMGVGKVPGSGAAHIWGIAAAGTKRVMVASPSWRVEPVSAALLVAPMAAAGPSQSEPVVAFAASLPVDADTCEPLIVRARDSGGGPLGSDRVSRWDRAYPSAPLTLVGSPACKAEQQPSLTVAALAAALRVLAVRLMP